MKATPKRPPATMQVVGLGCAQRGQDGLHRLDAALNLLPERYLVEVVAVGNRVAPVPPLRSVRAR